MTENFAALRVLQQHLLRGEDEPPFVLFGSSFPKDMEYTQVMHNICRCIHKSLIFLLSNYLLPSTKLLFLRNTLPLLSIFTVSLGAKKRLRSKFQDNN